MNKFQIVIDGRLFDVIPHQKATFKIYEGDKLISELSALSNFKGSFYWSNRDEDADERFDKLVGKAIEAYFPRGVNADMIDTGLYRMNIFVENMSEPFKIDMNGIEAIHYYSQSAVMGYDSKEEHYRFTFQDNGKLTIFSVMIEKQKDKYIYKIYNKGMYLGSIYPSYDEHDYKWYTEDYIDVQIVDKVGELIDQADL